MIRSILQWLPVGLGGLVIVPWLCLAQPDGGSGADFQYGDFDGIPGVHFEFKVDVSAGTEECFYQRIKQGAQLNVAFEVLRGADRNIDFSIRHPRRGIIDNQRWTSNGHTDLEIGEEGEYAICLDNSFSRFSSKLVYFSLAVFVQSEWQEFAQTTQDFEVSAESLQTAVDSFRRLMSKVLREMGMIRFHGSRDQYRVERNGSTVQTMSLLMICVFLMTSAVQVFFVRSMFKSVNVTPTRKPRA